MIRALVERLPMMICPRWIDTPTQPIAVDDVIAYLMAALELPDTRGGVFEIGGPDVVSYGDIMRAYARLRGLRRLLVTVPVLTPRLSGLWLALVTPAQAQVGRALVQGLKNATIVRSPAASETFALRPMPLNAAIAAAIDTPSPSWKTETRSVVVAVPPSRAFAPIRRIGGSAGWYYGRLLWSARGWMDRQIGGVGMSRGRRDPEACAVGDPMDGWTVEAYEHDRRLRLSADLKMPGRGWLEFEVIPVDDGRKTMIRQTATFDPRGWMGRAYWYALVPFHGVIFRGMLRQLSNRALAGGLMVLLMTMPLAAQSPSPVHTVDAVDLDRYAGDWLEIARFPNRFQRSCAGDVRASYSRRPGGRIEVINRCRSTDGGIIEARGAARIVDAHSPARLKVRFAPAALSFLPFVWGDYWILGLAADYSWAVVGSPDRDYLWILARTATLSAGSFGTAVAVAASNGFDVNRLVRTTHGTPCHEANRPRPRQDAARVHLRPHAADRT
jgi:lipocalin